MTVIGSSLKRKFQELDIPYVSVNGINEIDFSMPDTYKVLNTVNITKAIITYQPPLVRHTSSDGYGYTRDIVLKYFTGLTTYFKDKNIPFLYVTTQPLYGETKIMKENGGHIIEIPYVIDSKAIKDLENPTMRAVRECQKVGYSNIEYIPFLQYESVTADDVVEYILNHNNVKEDVLLRGYSSIDIETAIKHAVTSANVPNCTINFKNYPHNVPNYQTQYNVTEYIGKNVNIKEMIKNSYNNFRIIGNLKKKVHTSIVVPGRNDGYGIGFEQRIQNFINAIDYAIQMVPLAEVEVIFVDYATPTNNKLLSEILTIPKTISDKIRFIIVPPSIHEMLEQRYQTQYEFLEYVAKNIGTRRSLGKFILTTNADCLFPTEFFELVAAHQFNTAVIYRGNRWDLYPYTLSSHQMSMNDFIKIMSETWKLSHMRVNQWCRVYNRFAVIDSCDEYKAKAASCAPGDFQMLSRTMWDAMQGFNEVPANPATDSVFIARMLKLLPGYMRMFVHPLFFHQPHQTSYKRRKYFPKEMESKHDYCCLGNCLSCAPFYDRDDWGLVNYTFREVTF
ncbi:Methyltransferase FkbM family [Histomonas meleagridis]|uniref:Methyltransferase FkbM family n=1 Tax=Histomonas meleagridis TaxID=135588 RepID=UPI003559D095|nr:Methyltransferase FkbM family [Histomonas meleagridis]KAH0800664.1 Methyltransferase FkbM family [Histomonas meleagridis]